MTNSYIFGKSEKKIGGYLLKINQLVSGYGSVQILNGANMRVEKQSIVASVSYTHLPLPTIYSV